MAEELIEEQWREVQKMLFRRFKKTPDLQAALFLIGIQESGVLKQDYSKEEKQDLIHVAVCTLLSEDGYYRRIGKDGDGWPHFVQDRKLPALKVDEQEELLKRHIIRYFNQI